MAWSAAISSAFSSCAYRFAAAAAPSAVVECAVMSSERRSGSAFASTSVAGGSPCSSSWAATRWGTAPFLTISTVCSRFSACADGLLEFTNSWWVPWNSSTSCATPGAVTNPATTPTISPRAT